MKKATARPTAAQLQQIQAKADRKAEAIARLNGDDPRQDAGFKSMYTKTQPMKTKVASINRRLQGRLSELAKLGRGFNDAHLCLLQALSARYSNDELLAMGRAQTGLIWKYDAQIVEHFGLTATVQEGVTDDALATYNTPWAAWFVEEDHINEVKQFINNLVAA